MRTPKLICTKNSKCYGFRDDARDRDAWGPAGLSYSMVSPPGQKNSCLLDGAEVAATAVRATGAGLDATDASHAMASPDRAR